MTTTNNNENPIVQSNGYDGHEPTRKCPNCKKTKPLSEFGFRNMREKQNNQIKNQSWCKDCRSKK